ncbi:MAG: HD-GYP domain-containing protein, partial [Acidobacteria bacterium]
KDAYTSGHSIRVSQYAVATAERMGFAGQSLEGIRLGGELHDIGKIGTSETVLHKPGTLTKEEFDQITKHPLLGEKMLSPLAHDSPDVLRIVRSHHERLDGRGYPDGLSGDQAPLPARIVSVVDVFDALTTNRPYRRAIPVEAAYGLLLQQARGGWCEPDLVHLFIDVHRAAHAPAGEDECLSETHGGRGAPVEDGLNSPQQP